MGATARHRLMNPVRGFTPRQRIAYEIARARLNPGRCHWCEYSFGSPGVHRCDPSDDHLIPRSHGGSDAPSNLVRACLFCNNMRGSMDVPSWSYVAEYLVKPNRTDMAKMAEALAREGYESFAKAAASAQEIIDLHAVQEVTIRRWPREHTCGEFNAVLPLIRRDLHVDWHAFGLSLRLQHGETIGETQQSDTPFFSIGDGLGIRLGERLGWYDGQTFALVSMAEWKVIKTMTNVPEAVKFRKRSLDCGYRFLGLKHKRDRLVILTYRLNGGREVANTPLVFATSGAAALRLYERASP